MKKLFSAWLMMSMLVLSIVGSAMSGDRESPGDRQGPDSTPTK